MVLMPTATPSGEKPCKEVRTVSLQRQKIYGNSMVPDVTGMGARDAVFMLESRGLKVRRHRTWQSDATESAAGPSHQERRALPTATGMSNEQAECRIKRKEKNKHKQVKI
jgi:hypothetical protein